MKHGVGLERHVGNGFSNQRNKGLLHLEKEGKSHGRSEGQTGLGAGVPRGTA